MWLEYTDWELADTGLTVCFIVNDPKRGWQRSPHAFPLQVQTPAFLNDISGDLLCTLHPLCTVFSGALTSS
jgi:hypothetical protein